MTTRTTTFGIRVAQKIICSCCNTPIAELDKHGNLVIVARHYSVRHVTTITAAVFDKSSAPTQ